jgi:hypothetical protein
MNHIRFLATLFLIGGGILQAPPVAYADSSGGEHQVSVVVAGRDSTTSSEDNDWLGMLALPVARVPDAGTPVANHLSEGSTISLENRTDPQKPANPSLTPQFDGIPLFGEEMAFTDSLQAAVKPKLLPDRISFMEKAMWGEDGFFRNIGIASPLTPEVRKHELDVRRTMLTAHQIGGFVTLASMVTTVYFGQKYLNNGDRNDLDMHQTFIPITIVCYAATGLLSVLSPPPLIRRDETSTTTIHKTLAWVHFAGMILTPILGAAISKHGASYYDQARFHQIAAYITTAVFAASMIIITF